MSQSTKHEAIGQDCIKAVELASVHLCQKKIDCNEYTIIKAENLTTEISNDGPVTWVVIFKSRSLLPKKPTVLIGAGGELTLKVNIKTGLVIILGFGD